MHDVQAILDEIGSERAALFGVSEGGPMSLLYAASYPERTSALILYRAYAKSFATDTRAREKNKPTRFSRNASKLRIEEGTTRTRAKRAFNAIGCGLILASGWPLVYRPRSTAIA